MFELAIVVVFLLIGFWFGGQNEKKHFEELKKRETNLLQMSTRTDKGEKLSVGETFLVTGSVVIASDYFKNFVGSLRNFFGGRMSTHETLLDRARREAVIRMKEKAFASGAKSVVDVHIETSFLDQLGVEVSAYGTAVK